MDENSEEVEESDAQDTEYLFTDEQVHIVNAHSAMLKDIRSWGFWSLGLGALHVFSAGFLSAPWGISLIAVGLASFYFRTAPMYVIYGVTLAWAAFSNLTSLETGWGLFALLQVYFAYSVFRQYRRFRTVENEYIDLMGEDEDKDLIAVDRAAHIFPWLGSSLGCASIVGLGWIFAVMIFILMGMDYTASIPEYFGFLAGLAETVGLLGIAVCLAALLSGYRYKAVSIIGLVAGILTLIAFVALRFL